MSRVAAASHSPDQRRTWRSWKLPGRTNGASAGAETSAAWISTSASTRSSTARATLVLVRLEQRRQDVGDDVAVEVLHHVERLAEGVLLAERDDPRYAHAEPGERELQAGLAEHVVRRGRQRRPRRAPEHEPRPVPLDEEGDVRAAGPDPAHRGRAAAEAVLVEEALDVLEHEQRRDGERGRLGGGRDDVHGRGRGSHGRIFPRGRGATWDPNLAV